MERRLESDNRDGATLHLFTGNDGDYHLGVTNGARTTIGVPVVRFCLSGGVGAKRPKVLKAIADLYRALGEEDSGDEPEDGYGHEGWGAK